jgi:hypothetical protein
MYTRYRVDIGDGIVEAVAQNDDPTMTHNVAEGEHVSLAWLKDSCRRLADDLPSGAEVRVAAEADTGERFLEEEDKR